MSATRYTFLVRQPGYAADDPHYERWVKKYDSDAGAELFGRRISEDHGGASVMIRRGDAQWSVRCGFVPTR